MTKKRVIAALVIKSGWLVQSFDFKTYLPVGRPEIAADFLNQWGVDEIIIQDIDATARGNISIELLHKLTKYSYCPLTYAGGLNSVEDMVLAVREGADKVCINTALYDNSELLEEGAKILGNQCLVASIDYKKNSSNNWITYSNSGKQCQNIELVTWAKEIESKGAGEILINSIDRDGKKMDMTLKHYKQ